MNYQYKFLKKKPLRYKNTIYLGLFCALWALVFSGQVSLGALFISCALHFYLVNYTDVKL